VKKYVGGYDEGVGVIVLEGVMLDVGVALGVAPGDMEGVGVGVAVLEGVPDGAGELKSEQMRLTEPTGPLLEAAPPVAPFVAYATDVAMPDTQEDPPPPGEPT